MIQNQITTFSIEEREELSNILRTLRKTSHLEGRVLIDIVSRAENLLKKAGGIDFLIKELIQKVI